MLQRRQRLNQPPAALVNDKFCPDFASGSPNPYRIADWSVWAMFECPARSAATKIVIFRMPLAILRKRESNQSRNNSGVKKYRLRFQLVKSCADSGET
jgi:hypothetical protein